MTYLCIGYQYGKWSEIFSIDIETIDYYLITSRPTKHRKTSCMSINSFR